MYVTLGKWINLFEMYQFSGFIKVCVDMMFIVHDRLIKFVDIVQNWYILFQSAIIT